MAKLATLSESDKGKLDRALKQQRKAARNKERKEKLEKRDNLLARIPPLPEYEPMTIEDCVAVSHLPDDIEITPYSVFSLIWTSAVWDILCNNTNLYAFVQDL